MQILLDANITFNFLAFEEISGVYNFGNEVRRCIDELLSNNNYESALQLSQIAQVQSSDIILAKVYLLTFGIKINFMLSLINRYFSTVKNSKSL